jgi:hypothetical protein
MKTTLLLSAGSIGLANAFVPAPVATGTVTHLYMAEGAEAKEAKLVSGEELEVMLTEWDQPLVVDAYATW